MAGREADHDAPLTAPHHLEYAYRRSVGPVLGRFFTGLRDRQICGVRTRAGRVLVPPAEYDPDTGEATTEDFVDVGPGGTVTSWTWVPNPRTKQPLQQPFAFALIKLDGADTPFLHAVDALDETRMRTGMRVRARWRAETKGEIADIACFEPEA
jgi:uncharacterized OB-fold protein